MRILLIEDDKNLSELMTYGLEAESYIVDCCPDGNDGLLMALQNIHDLILLDRMLPSIAGEMILTRIRKHGITTPVIFITALDDAQEKINCLDLGADDYLVKPFDIGELLARIRSVMRRATSSASTNCLHYGDLDFLEKESTLIYQGKPTILTKTENELLSYFFRNPEQTLSRSQIIGNVWGLGAEIEDGNLDNFIYLLRKKLRSIGTEVQIVTKHRQGYCLSDKQRRS